MVNEVTESLITNIPPSFHVKTKKTTEIWLDSKRDDDNVESGLWRIHNTLYDLTEFIDKHPGGPSWLQMTKGLDITEAFISHHIFMNNVEPYLKKYRVRDTDRPRNVKLTFNDDGFYMTLKRKVVAKLPEIKKNTKVYSKFYIDGLFALTLLTAALAQRFQSIPIAILCSLFFTWTGISGHNFLHQRDNYRMFYLNLIFQNYRDWRISHVLSHHLYPNSLLDMELLSFQPFVVWVPNSSAKNWIQRYVSYIYSPILYLFIYILGFTTKLFARGFRMYIDDFIPFIVPVVMYIFGGNQTFVDALKLFMIITLSGGFIFSIIGVNVGHHHPLVVHEGDAVRKGYDWGIYSIDTTMDRQELRGNALMTLANLGDHALHHLFPTLDHGLLPELYEDFFETLLEFEAECLCYPWFFEIIKGQFQQASRIEPMKFDSHDRFLMKYGQKTKVQ